jgi:hypothetical protein
VALRRLQKDLIGERRPGAMEDLHRDIRKT